MSPKDLALLHPFLYHVTEPGAWENIRKTGLLSTSCILDLYTIQGESRAIIEARRRGAEIPLEHDQHGRMVINDNVPLSENALLKCLDDGLTPSDWFLILNKRVFFWSTEESLQRHLNAKLNRNRKREIIVVDTFKLATTHAERMELSPINSGATIRKPARRGLKTFTPLSQYSYTEWRKLRGRKDTIREVTVREGVLDIKNHVVDVYQI